MAVSDIEAVLLFLKKNGFTEAENAFKQDISEKKDLKSFDFEKFEFPISPPPPPPVRIGLDHRQFQVSNVFYASSDNSDDSSSDFMSMGSFNTDGSTSGFTNPYGIRTGRRIKSEASSAEDFGTARDYRDIDILNNNYWYDEKDEDYLKHSSFGKADFLACPPEDKFVTTLEAEGRYEQPASGLEFGEGGFHSETSIVCLDKSCPLYNMPMNYERDLKLQDCYDLDQTMQSKQGHEEGLECFDQSDNRMPLCDCCARLQEGQGVNSEDCRQLYALNESNMSVTQLRKVGSGHYDCDLTMKNEKEGSFRHPKDNHDTEDLRHETKLQLAVIENSSTSYRDDEYEREDVIETLDELHDPVTVGQGEECSTPSELQMYESREDEYEVFNLRIVHRKNRTGFEANKDLPIVLNTTLAGRYYVTEYLGSAAFSRVVQAHDLHTGVDVCLKIIKNDKDFFDQSLDEIKLLKFVNKHDPGDEHHILRLYDYFYHQEHLFIVCELLRANLYEFLKYNQESGGEPYFTLPRLQMITRQCLEALEYLHSLGIIHCDLKPENILIKSYSRCEIKVIDLGSSCFQTDNLCLYVQSRSYRAPEVILGVPYDQRIDIWSLGCILAELCSGEVLFPNDALVTLLERMIAMFGPIDMEMLVKGQETHKYFTKDYEYLYHINEETSELQYVIPEQSSLENFVKSSDNGFTEFVKYLLEVNPMIRPTASEALQHPWLSQVYDS
ncbi:hypothetical protein ACHQM5_020803 [Ranunculus cassubicifolius]